MKINHNCFSWVGLFFVLIYGYSKDLQAEVVHKVRFCRGIICSKLDQKPLSIGLQLELNQRFNEGGLIAIPTSNTYANKAKKEEIQLAYKTYVKKI